MGSPATRNVEEEQAQEVPAELPPAPDTFARRLSLVVTWPVRRPAGGHAYDLALAFDAHPLAVGKDFLGPLGVGAWLSPTGTGVQLELILVGATLVGSAA